MTLATAVTLPNRASYPAPEINLDLLRPQLCTLDKLERAELSDPEFGRRPASIALSAQLRVAFQLGEAGEPLSFTQLEAANLTTMTAWERSCHNVIDAAGSAARARFRIRPASVLLGTAVHGLQLHSAVAPTSVWLTHPTLFASIDAFVKSRLHTNNVAFICPEPEVLFAVDGASINNAKQRAMTLWQESDRLITCEAFACQSGYPHAVA